MTTATPPVRPADESPPGRRRRPLGRIWIVALLGLLTLPAQANVLAPFSATFEVKRGAIGLGTTAFSLRAVDADNCYRYRGEAFPNALVRLFIGNVTDESRFCIEDDALRPTYFSHQIEGDAEDSYTLNFDWPSREVRYANQEAERETLALGAQGLDPLSIQIAARRWVDAAEDPRSLGEQQFTLVDSDEIKTYTLRASHGGSIDTPAGRYDTVLVERVDSSRRLRFWLAETENWIPVQVEHQKGDGGIFRMSLTALER